MKQLFTIIIAAALSMSAQAQARYLSTSGQKLDVSIVEKSAPVQLSRILLAGYNSICLPMTLNAQQLQAAAPDVQVERLVAIRQEGTTLNLYFIDCTDEGIEAGQPYLIFSPKAQYLRARTNEAVAVSTRLQPVTFSDGEGNRVTFSSAWDAMVGDGRYGIPAQQDTDILQSILVRTTADKTFLPTRCGFTWEAQSATATKLEIKHVTSLDGIETRINDLRAANATVEVYDLAGRHAATAPFSALRSKLAPGVYVINGVKVAIK